jgi:hypothetical protein
MSRRGGQGGEEELAAMWAVMKAAESACVNLIDDLQGQGSTWESMAAPLGITRQGLYRWAHRQGRVLDGHAQAGEALAAPVNRQLTDDDPAGPGELEAGS